MKIILAALVLLGSISTFANVDQVCRKVTKIEMNDSYSDRFIATLSDNSELNFVTRGVGGYDHAVITAIAGELSVCFKKIGNDYFVSSISK